MRGAEGPVTILLAEDDADDQLLITRALTTNNAANDIRAVSDGEELLEYLRHSGRYSDPSDSPRPYLILLDLNMPRKSGREALREIKQDPELRSIPIVILTTSQAEVDVLDCYAAGANAYITKPVTFAELNEIIRALEGFWLGIVRLPT